MKMVKSLLLGSAAGLVAMAGAQAADLPVKAKPVQYVKICSLYGAGFYYIPGTDTCIKIGGFVRAEMNFNASHSFAVLVNGDHGGRNLDFERSRARGVITFDVRSQTEYGTLRSYLTAGHQVSSGLGGSSGVFQTGTYTNRAFIQWAGFTAGLANSFYGLFTFARYSNQTNWLTADVGGAGIIVFAYTAQFGNGLSATISTEDTGGRRIGSTTTGIYTQGYGGREWPDVVGNLRIDQAWGSAIVMGAVHQVRGLASGDAAGWAVGAGLLVNLPWGAGDNFSVEGSYSRGALSYALSGVPATAFTVSNGGTSIAYGNDYDAVTNAGGGLELTEAWSVGAGAVHHWNAMWQTSLYGGYGAIHYNSTAAAVLNGASGDPDWNFAQIGSRTVWTPVKNLALSVDVIYNHVDTATAQAGVDYLTASDIGWFAGIFRAQRNFWP